MVQPLWQPWPILWPSVVKRCALVGAAGVGGWGTRCVLVPPFWFCDGIIGKRGSALTFWVSTGKLCILVYDQPGEGWSGCHEEGLGAMSQRYITLPGLMARPETGECVETTPNQEVLLSHFFSREAVWQKKVSWNWCCYIFRKAFPSKFQAFQEFWDFDGVVCFSCLIHV